MEALQRSTIPDINNRPNNFLESITLCIENGSQLINKRRDAKEKANGNQLINDRAARPKATKKRDSPAKTSTKITPTQKRKKLKRSPTNDCAKDTIASSSSSFGIHPQKTTKTKTKKTKTTKTTTPTRNLATTLTIPTTTTTTMTMTMTMTMTTQQQ
jgi:hypothetical protein